MGVLEDIFNPPEPKQTAPPPVPKRSSIEDLDNELRRRRRKAQASGRSSLITGTNVPQNTGISLPGLGNADN